MPASRQSQTESYTVGRAHTPANTRPPFRRASSDRAQTGVDFIVGVGVFLLTVAFVLSFVPGLMSPFDGEATTPPLVADRTADSLVYEALAATGSPGTLDEPCTLAFFDTGASDSDCAFADDGPASEWLGIPAGMHLNVTIEKDVDATPGREPICGDATDVNFTCETGSLLVHGDPVPSSGASVATAARVVTLDGTNAVLVVRVW